MSEKARQSDPGPAQVSAGSASATGAVAGLSEQLLARFAEDPISCHVFAGEVTLEIPTERILPICRALRDEPAFGFGQLVDLCGIDYAQYGIADWNTDSRSGSFSRGISPGVATHGKREGERFAVVYHLLSHANNQRLRVRAYAPGDPPQVDSVVVLWQSADWFEREAFDLFGIRFEGHPDLRRILTNYGFVGHPLRKDFPLSGNRETRYDPEKGRVVYEPTTLEPRASVPKVIRKSVSSADAGDTATAPT